MKKLFISALAFLMGASAFAQDKSLTAMFNYSTHYLPDKQQSYVETYLTFDAWTMQFAKGDDGQHVKCRSNHSSQRMSYHFAVCF